MKDNFDQYAWNTNRILENEMSDAAGYHKSLYTAMNAH